ncbi:MAG: TolB family protein [Flavisolibacter sp.]
MSTFSISVIYETPVEKAERNLHPKFHYSVLTIHHSPFTIFQYLRINMKSVTALAFLLISLTGISQNNTLGIFDNNSDIGNPKNPGSASYNASSQSYHLKGSGYNIWFNRDEFNFLYKKIAGDFILTANFEFLGNKGNEHRKIGWMVRESLDEGAASMNAVVHGDGLTVLQWRELRGAYMRDPEDEIFYPKKSAEIIQLERSGKTMIMRVAHIGEPLQVVGWHVMPSLKDSVYAGLCISSHDPDRSEEASVWNVRIDRPVPNDYSPNPQIQRTLAPFRGTVGCRMEIMNVFDGKRKVILSSNDRFEAPNWMPDGKRLLYNSGGSIYTIPIEGGTTEKINTDTVKRNNNDHGISFDGKMLAISSHRSGLPGGGSTVYVLPLSGGTPRLLTESTPSYWHGWDPNGKDVTIVAQRNGGSIYNIYKVSVKDGKETALTQNTTGHVDGPEYSPDSKYIYYNANPTGTMQIWRMRPDGSGKEQLTFDEYHNWFPHISPDGKWMVFISFPPDIDPNAHPANKQVMLRLMPVSGGAPKVVAYLYGGQGTINVNSWSPDSKSIAFVSNY